MKTKWVGSVKRGDKREVPSDDRANYVRELAWELITRIPTDHYVSKPMLIGQMFEDAARIEYWQSYWDADPECEVEQTGFVLHPTLDWLGCSPDGLVLARNRGVEIKVPTLKVHEGYITDDAIPEEYACQMQCNMLCTGLPEWDFVSYAPPEMDKEYGGEHFPDELRLFVKTLKADPAEHRKMEAAATAVMEEAIEEVNRLLKRYPKLGKPIVFPRPSLVPQLEKMVEMTRPSGYDDSKSFVDNCDFIEAGWIVP